MSIFDEHKEITKDFLKKEGFELEDPRSYLKYRKYFILKHNSIINVTYYPKSHNLYIEKAPHLCTCNKYKVYNVDDFLVTIKTHLNRFI